MKLAGPFLRRCCPNRFLQGKGKRESDNLEQVLIDKLKSVCKTRWSRLLTGWRPPLVGWRPPLLLGWRPSLVGWRPLPLVTQETNNGCMWCIHQAFTMWCNPLSRRSSTPSSMWPGTSWTDIRRGDGARSRDRPDGRRMGHFPQTRELHPVPELMGM